MTLLDAVPKRRLSAYVPVSEHDEIETAARQNGFSVAAFSRYLIKIGYREFLDDPAKILVAMQE